MAAGTQSGSVPGPGKGSSLGRKGRRWTHISCLSASLLDLQCLGLLAARDLLGTAFYFFNKRLVVAHYSASIPSKLTLLLLIEALVMASTFSPSPHTHHQPYHPLCALNMGPPCSHLSVLTSTALVHAVVLELVEPSY